MMKKFLTKRNIILAIVLVLIVGVLWWRNTAAKKSAEASQKVVVVKMGNIVEELSVSGKVQAEKKANLTFPLPGKLSYAKAAEGEEVKKGQWLMGLDKGDLDAAVVRAWYTYLAADANAKQVEDSLKDHDKDETFSQKNTRVAAQTARDMAYDAWLTARRAADNATLKAPFDGIITNVTANVIGDTVGVTDGVTVVDPKSLYFEIEIDESDLGKVTLDKKVTVLLDAYEEREFMGEIKWIGFESKISSSGATVYPAKVEITGDDESLLRVGMNGDAKIELGRAENVLVLPAEAVFDNQVTIVDDKKIQVQTGLESDTEVEIKEGLKEGDKVVIK